MAPDLAEAIVVDPEVQGGTPVVSGTRVPVAALIEAMAAGDSPSDVAAAYELTVEQVQDALRYAAYVIRSERYVALPR